MDFPSLLRSDAVFLEVLGYKMSWIEFFGTVLNLWSVWLVTRKSIWTWPVGIVAVVLLALLFYQIQLYSDFVEQIYFLVTGFYGWWAWSRGSRTAEGAAGEVRIERASNRALAWTAIAVGGGTVGLGLFMSHAHELAFTRRIFPEPASFAYLDAFTTVMSFAAQILMARRFVESWWLWIAVDVIGIWLYQEKEIPVVAILYAIFLVLATRGWFRWRADLRRQAGERATPAG